METPMELYYAGFPAWQLNKEHIGSAPKTHTIASPGSNLSLDSNSRKKNKDLWTGKDAKKKAPLLTGDSTSMIHRTNPPPE